MKKIAGAALGFSVGFFVHWLVMLAFRDDAPKSVPPVGNAELSDLVVRLAPLTKEPGSSYWGVRVLYTGAGVKIEMRMANNDQLSAESSTLAGAVERLTAPSAQIRAAISGWKAP